MFSAVLNNGAIWVAGGEASIAYSTTGKTWTTVLGGPSQVNSLAWTGTHWLACCDGSNNLYVSSDGVNWSLNTTLTSYTLHKIAFANNTLFALSVGTIFYTTNLNTWSSKQIAGVGNITGFAYTGTHYKFSSNSTLITTLDLVSWTTSSLPGPSTTLAINNSANGVATVKPIVLACSDSSYNTLGYTYDGIQWYGCGNTVLRIRANHAAWNGNIWVAVGKSDGTWFAISKDGINWQQQIDTLFSEAFAVAWNGEEWVAAGEGAAFSLARSTDGVHWSGIAGSKTQLFPSKAVDIKWNGRHWIACGETTVAFFSNGFSTWTTGVVGDLSSVLLPIAVATASSGVYPEYAIDFSDSTAWTSQSAVYSAGVYTGSDPSGGEWLEIDMGSGGTAFKQYYLRSNAAQWSLYGSLTGSSPWTLIDSRVDASNVFFPTANTTPYIYYRFVFQKIVSGPSTNVQINSVDFFVDKPLSPYYKLSNTKRWLSWVVNTGYSSIMQYNGVIQPTASLVFLPTSYSYDGQYHLLTDLSNANLYYSADFNTFTAVSLPTIAQKYASCFNGTHFFVGGSGANIMYAHPSDMTAWYSVSNADTTFTGGSILALVSNPGIGFVCPPNGIYLTPGDKLSLVAPKFYDENMEKRGAVFNFSLN